MDGPGESHSLRGFSRGVAVFSDVSLMLILEMGCSCPIHWSDTDGKLDVLERRGWRIEKLEG